MNRNEREYCLKLRKATRALLVQAEKFYLQANKEVESLLPISRQEEIRDCVDIVDTGRYENTTLRSFNRNEKLTAARTKEDSLGFERSSTTVVESDPPSHASGRTFVLPSKPTQTTVLIHEPPKPVELTSENPVKSTHINSDAVYDCIDEISEFIEMVKQKPRRVLLVSDKIYHNISNDAPAETEQVTLCSNQFHCVGGCYCSKASKVKPLLSHCIHCQYFNPLLRKKNDLKLSTVGLSSSKASRSWKSEVEDKSNARKQYGGYTQKTSRTYRACVPDVSNRPKHRVFSYRESRHSRSPFTSSTNVLKLHKSDESSNSVEPYSSHSPVNLDNFSSNSKVTVTENDSTPSYVDQLIQSTSNLKIQETKQKPTPTSKKESKSCQTLPIRMDAANNNTKLYSFNSEGCGDGQRLGPTNVQELHRVREFRNNNLFECHSSTSLLERDKDFMSNVMHTCQHDFYLNDRLFPTPCNPDHKNESRCRICALPIKNIKMKSNSQAASQNRIDREAAWIRVDPLAATESDDEIGVLNSKVIIEPNGIPAEMFLKFPMKDSILVQERKSSPVKPFNKTPHKDALKLNSRVFHKVEPPLDSLALKYQKGYRELKKFKS